MWKTCSEVEWERLVLISSLQAAAEAGNETRDHLCIICVHVNVGMHVIGERVLFKVPTVYVRSSRCFW